MNPGPHLRTSSSSKPLSMPPLDTHVLPHSTLPSPSKDKDKMRHWVFPRGSASPPTGHSSNLGGHSAGGLHSPPRAGGGMDRSQNEALIATGTAYESPEQSRRQGSSLGSLKEDSTWSSPPSLSTFSSPSTVITTPSSSPISSSKPFSSPSPSHAFESRHKLNTSIAYTYQPSLSLSLTSTPSDLARMAYTNLRRKSLNDLLYFFIFFISVLIFFSALSGTGYEVVKDATPSPRAGFGVTGKGGRKWPKVREMTDVKDAIDVPIPEAFLPKPVDVRKREQEAIDDDTNEEDEEDEEEDEEVPPADVHQPNGDSSHDIGEDFLKDSPDDPALDDENVHEIQNQPGKKALFKKHPIDPSLSHLSTENNDANIDAPSDSDVDVEADADDDEDEEDEEADEEDDDEDEVEVHAALNAPHHGHGHEDTFQAHPDATSEEEDQANQQRLGDSFRRPNTKEGMKAMKEERDKIVRERERWLENMRVAGEGKVAEKEKKRVGKRLMR